jgi:hypothetical protein
MDEVLDLVGFVAELVLGNPLTWLVRVVGVIVILAGLGLWLFTESGLLVLPAILIVTGLLLAAFTEVLVAFTEPLA